LPIVKEKRRMSFTWVKFAGEWGLNHCREKLR
jgi:hypothetical protein